MCSLQNPVLAFLDALTATNPVLAFLDALTATNPVLAFLDALTDIISGSAYYRVQTYILIQEVSP